MKDNFVPDPEEDRQHANEMRRLLRRNKNIDHSTKRPTSKKERQWEDEIPRESKKKKRRFDDQMD